MSISSRLIPFVAFPALGLSVLLTGCTLQTTASPGAAPGVVLNGNVHGGQQPVVGSHVHLLAAAATGYGVASTSLLTLGTAGNDAYGGYVLTDSTGAFSVTGDYSCVAGTQVYMLATQGNPGLGGNQNNPNLALMAVLGQCPATGTFASTVPFIWINEVTTAASVYAISGFMTDLAHVSSSSTPQALTGIANAFAAFNNLAGISTGAALTVTPAGNGTPPQTEINTLANIIGSCINTAGLPAPACSTLFSNAVEGATQPADTVTAALNIAHHPAANVGTLFGLQVATPPFVPALTGAPNDFTVAITYTGGGIYAPVSVAVDGNNNVWMVNLNTSLSEINGVTGAAISPATGYTGGGLYAPFSVGIDPLGNAWVVNENTTVSKFTSTGAPAIGSPFSGGGLSNPLSFNVVSPRDVAFDATGNVWIANASNGSVSELNGVTGVPISPSTGYVLAATQTNPSGVAVDSGGHIWVSGMNGNRLYELSDATGAVLFTSGYTANGLEQPYSIAIDASNNIWLPNQYDPNTLVGANISEFNNSGAAVTGSPFGGGGILGPDGVAIDGSSNIWISNQIHSSITELNNSGVPVCPGGGFLSAGLFAGADIAVDSSGNVWVPNAATSTFANGVTLVEFVGAATPTVTPIAVAVSLGKLGARP